MISENYPGLIPHYDELYRGSYNPGGIYWITIDHKVCEVCDKYGLKDRMPRWIPESPLAMNKRVSEHLFLRVHEFELHMVSSSKIWAYRKAAWSIDELDISIAQIYGARGLPVLLDIPDVGKNIAHEIENFLRVFPRT